MPSKYDTDMNTMLECHHKVNSVTLTAVLMRCVVFAFSDIY